MMVIDIAEHLFFDNEVHEQSWLNNKSQFNNKNDETNYVNGNHDIHSSFVLPVGV